VVGAQRQDAPCSEDLSKWAIVYGSVNLVLVPFVALWAAIMVGAMKLGGGRGGACLGLMACCSLPIMLAAAFTPFGLLIWGTVLAFRDGHLKAWQDNDYPSFVCDDQLYRTVAVCIIITWCSGVLLACAGRMFAAPQPAAGAGAAGLEAALSQAMVAAAAENARRAPGGASAAAHHQASGDAAAKNGGDAVAVSVHAGGNPNGDEAAQAAVAEPTEAQPA
jgi:hypothetical protein